MEAEYASIENSMHEEALAEMESEAAPCLNLPEMRYLSAVSHPEA